MNPAFTALALTSAFSRLLPGSPDGAIALATLGLCLIFLELNRPGWILPGALGLSFMLCSVPALLPGTHPVWALALLTLLAGLCAVHLWVELPGWTPAASAVLLILATRFLLGSPGRHVHWITAAICGGLIGSLSTSLARVARRAREAKHSPAKQVN